MAFQIFTDTSSGLPKDLRDKHHIEYFKMGLLVNDKLYDADLDFKEFSREQMFDWVRDPKVTIRTSLVTREEFVNKMKPYLEKGIDILYIACTDALSGTRQSFEILIQDLLEQYPGRRIVSINSCRAEMALGLLVIEACKEQEKGKDMDEVIKYVEENKQYYHEVGSVDTLKYLKAYGRVSGAARFFADTLNIKPLIMFDREGHNYTYKKVHGANKAMIGAFDYIKDNIVDGVTEVIYVGRTTPIPAYEYLKKRVEEELLIKVIFYDISPIVSICCGPGMYGAWFKGKEVTVLADK